MEQLLEEQGLPKPLLSELEPLELHYLSVDQDRQVLQVFFQVVPNRLHVHPAEVLVGKPMGPRP